MEHGHGAQTFSSTDPSVIGSDCLRGHGPIATFRQRKACPCVASTHTLADPHRKYSTCHRLPCRGAPHLAGRFARNLQHPRWLYVLPNGDVLVAETNAPERPEEGKGIKGWFMKLMMKKAGAAPTAANCM